MSHEISPYNTVMSQEKHRNMPQMQTVHLNHLYIFPDTDRIVWKTELPTAA